MNDRLARLLDNADLPWIVPRLAPAALQQLIRHRGLEACGALLAAATPQQLASILDLELWRTTPGRDDQFDEQRFGAWLEALMEEGEAVAAHVVAAMDHDLAIAGLSRYVRVFDPGVFQPSMSSDDDPGDLASAQALDHDIGGYVVRARTVHAWDAIVGLLVTLAEDRPETFHALMQGCRRLSNSIPEADGFHHLMSEPEQSLHDVSLERDDRRVQQGYLGAADARAFLESARAPQSSPPNASSPTSPITAAYFRALDEMTQPADQRMPRQDPSAAPIDPELSESIDAVADLLREAGVALAQPRRLLGPAVTDVVDRLLIHRLMEYVHDRDQAAYFARSRELAFVANALVAGCSVYSRALTIHEAWDAAVGVCNLGLELWPERWPAVGVEADRTPEAIPALPSTFLLDHDILTAFAVGWRLLHEDVSMSVTTDLIAALENLRNVDSETQRDLYRLRRDLERNREAGTPWRAGESLETIAIIDMPTWACLCGLLSECPVFPAALTAILDGHGGSVSASSFECFTTRAQIRRVREFGERLGDLLLS